MDKFSDRVKGLRLKMNLSQKELADRAGLSTRTIQYYELNERMPKNIEILNTLADILHTTPEYLVGKKGVFVAEAYDKGGAQSARDINELVTEVTGVFAGGELDDAALDGVMRALTEAYWIAKDNNKKYGNKKGRKKKRRPAEPDDRFDDAE